MRRVSTSLGLLAVTATIATAITVVLLARDGGFHPAQTAPAERPDPAPRQHPAAIAPRAPRVEYLIVAGGPTPDANEASIERDAELALTSLGGAGRVLFAGGPGTLGVQVRDPTPRLEPLNAVLADLFLPRRGRDAHFAQVNIAAHGPASRPSVERELHRLFGSEGAPAILAFHGHGEQGAGPKDGRFVLWGQSSITASELAEWLDTNARRGVRLVATSCFSGGFAELAFAGADPSQGPTAADRCGLFASTWDLEAAGCDPAADARHDQSYGVHFWNALQGRDRLGAGLAVDDVDFDHDGRVSFLEAHTRVRIASEAADVPTSTSERWLRHADPKGEGGPVLDMPEERAAIQALALRLDRVGREQSAGPDLEVIEEQIDASREDLEDARDLTSEAWSALTGVLLARWPALDDPWHPDFASTLANHRAAIQSFIEQAPEAEAWSHAVETEARFDDFLHALRMRAAPIERLARAVENVRLARLLAQKGGADWSTYERLRACERFVP